jgi:isoleucyl-tRNA synthetase
MQRLKIADYEILKKFTGAELEFMQAQHPFLDKKSLVINGEHVTLEAGTGCVHTAPGHGAEDFDICQKYDNEKNTDIGVVVPVDAKGFMTKEAGKFEGLKYNKANDAIFNDLSESGALVAYENIKHQYPHCWRCKNPIIYRATEQWFASVSDMTEAAVKACDDIQWVPKWGKERMIAMIVERSDWCISRQRNWGVPIPIFYCKDCGEYLINDETINIVSDLFKAKGSNAWFECEAEEILPSSVSCPKCGGNKFRKETDIMDVWFDSGSTHSAVLKERPELHFPAEIYLEGGDQYRGWFQSSMLTSIAVNGVAPYKTIITHGWTVDGQGKAMHKSVGNVVAPEDVIRKNGADILRLWVSSVEFTNDVKISDDVVKQLSEVYRKIRNTARIILGNLYDFNPDTDAVANDDLLDIDKWVLSRLNNLVKDVRESYENYEFHNIYHYINNFCSIDLSKLYIDITKDRVYVEKSESRERRAAQTVMYTVLDALVKMLTPILAFTTEEIWGVMPHKKSDNIESVLLNDMPSYDETLTFGDIEKKWDKIFDLRDEVMKALETARNDGIIGKSLEAKLAITTSDDSVYQLLDEFSNELSTIFIVSQVELIKGNTDNAPINVCVSVADGTKCDRCWTHSTHGKKTENGFICDRCAKIIGV